MLNTLYKNFVKSTVQILHEKIKFTIKKKELTLERIFKVLNTLGIVKQEHSCLKHRILKLKSSSKSSSDNHESI